MEHICIFFRDPIWCVLLPILHEGFTCDFNHMIHIVARWYDDSNLPKVGVLIKYASFSHHALHGPILWWLPSHVLVTSFTLYYMVGSCLTCNSL
jgi:hypothetical protein